MHSTPAYPPFPRDLRASALSRKINGHDLSFFEAIVGRQPRIEGDEAADASRSTADAAARTPGSKEAKITSFDPSRLALRLREVCEQQAGRVRRPRVADWLRHVSDQAFHRLEQAHARLTQARPRTPAERPATLERPLTLTSISAPRHYSRVA